LSEAEVGNFSVIEKADHTYAIQVANSYLRSMAKGTYTLGLLLVSDEIDALQEAAGTRHTTAVNLSLTVDSTEPKVTIVNPTINLYDTKAESRKSLLSIAVPAAVTKVEILEGQTNHFATYFTVSETSAGSGSYQIAYTEDASYRVSSMSGKIRITVAGYEPIERTIKVFTPSTAPKRSVEKELVLDAGNGESAYVNILEGTTKQKTSDYSIVSNSEPRLHISKQADGRLRVYLADGVSVKDGTKLTAKLQLNSAEGSLMGTIPVTLSVIVKSQAPKVKASKGTLALNLSARGEADETYLTIDRNNVELYGNSAWNTYFYNKATKNYQRTNDFTIAYQKGSGLLSLSLSENAVVASGSYQLMFRSMVEGYETQEYPILKVNVMDKPVTASVKMSGTIDLLNRSKKMVNTVVTVCYAQTKLVGVRLESKDYYPVLTADNAFTIRLRQSTQVEAGKVVIPVTLTLAGGTVVKTSLTIMPTQSIPKVTVPVASTIYKSNPKRTQSYPLSVPEGVSISRIAAVLVPEGISVTTSENVVYLHLSNNNIKPGTYSIKVNSYFTGAQTLFGYPEGKPVTSVISVKVAE